MLVDLGIRMLAHLGYQVTGETDSRLALETFCRDPQRFDLVITDQTMPGLLGTELAEQMIDIRPDLPVLLCSGYGTRTTEEKAGNSGIHDVLPKPLSLPVLARTVAEALNRNNEC
ncbi:hypothetical protein GF1_01510 [Desulfolithobacter dissulfuricans]|uniref:Response regulatory domain-containing protein n=1 Tax=Desulfolithobacter dissulfuricans TaxID=2795293 RepID=A0A915U8X0_9BACT|nr:response regulator [Desulfolithobacter dissulfuricans]BCO07775.1 hypothetical protein GF1_01510 [Desulfolithobacter dissulfuricans]